MRALCAGLCAGFCACLCADTLYGHFVRALCAAPLCGTVTIIVIAILTMLLVILIVNISPLRGSGSVAVKHMLQLLPLPPLLRGGFVRSFVRGLCKPLCGFVKAH